MFKQIHASTPKFKLALNSSSSSSSLKKRFGASSGKEAAAPRPLFVKSGSLSGECKGVTNNRTVKKPSGYSADISSDLSDGGPIDSIMDDSLFSDCEDDSSFNFEGAYTSSPRQAATKFHFNDTFNLRFGSHSVEDAFDITMYDIVANDSVGLTKKRLSSIISRGNNDEDDDDWERIYVMEGIVADGEDVEDDFVVEGDSGLNADISSFEEEPASDDDEVTGQDVEYDDEDMLEDGDLVWDLPGIIVTSPSDGDLISTVPPIVELDYMSIVDQGAKYFLLDGTLHNWNLRFNTGEIFPNHDLRGSGQIEAAGIQLLVSSPSDGDLQFENVVEKEFEIEDILDRSYRTYLLDASAHNWNMRFNFDNYLRELQGDDDAPYDEDEVC